MIEVSRIGPVTVVKLNRPEVRNAINTATAQQLREAWLEFEDDPHQCVGILTGTDTVFCAGADLTEIEVLLTNADQGAGPLGIGRMMLSKPTIAAVAGYAVAGGFELALWCDLCIADETATFGFFERRFGVPLLNGGSKRLSEIVGLRRALDIVLTGRPIRANEAYTLGIASEIVDEGKALDRALELAQYLASVPQVCLHSDRKAVYDNLAFDLDEALIHEARLARETIATGEAIAEVQEFRSRKQI